MQVTLNGKPTEVSPDLTVAALLEGLSLGSKRVAVEVNEQVIPRARHAETRLQPADRVEVVTFVGGG